MSFQHLIELHKDITGLIKLTDEDLIEKLADIVVDTEIEGKTRTMLTTLFTSKDLAIHQALVHYSKLLDSIMKGFIENKQEIPKLLNLVNIKIKNRLKESSTPQSVTV